MNLTVNYLDKAGFKMSAFEDYFVYLADRGNHVYDIEATRYCETLIRSANPIDVDQLVRIATLWLRLKRPKEARTDFVEARNILLNNEEANAELVALVDQGIQACDRPLK